MVPNRIQVFLSLFVDFISWIQKGYACHPVKKTALGAAIMYIQCSIDDALCYLVMENEKLLSRDDALQKKLTEAVLDNLDNEQFGVTELSRAVGISRFHLHRKLKVLQGKSVSQFIREIRLAEAKKLLQHDVGTVAEVAYRVGFTSPSYFNKCFQAYYGHPPGEVKKLDDPEMADAATVPDLGVLNKTSSAEKNASSQKRPVIKKSTWALVFLIGLGSIIGYYFFSKEKVRSPVEKSIAVLPFNNLSSDPENQHFTDGLVEDLLTRLSVIQEFKVISRTSSEMYRERGAKSIPQIARELGVAFIVEGSVQKIGAQARINIQLIDAREDDHVWSQNFDRNISDIFITQSEIATHIATKLNTILTNEQTLDIQKNRTTSFKAFELYHLGRFYWNKRSGDGYAVSIDYFEKAIAEDPDYGLAYAGLSDTYHLMAIQGFIDRKEGRDKAVELALQSLQLDKNLAEAYTVLGDTYSYIDGDWDAAREVFQRAIEINPNYSTVHHYYSEFLSITHDHDAARRHINRALELDPLSFVIRWVSTKLYYHQGKFHDALAENIRSLELQKNHPWALWYSFLIHRQLGMDDKAFSSFLMLYADNGKHDLAELKEIYAASGLDGVLRWSIDLEFRHEPSSGYGSAYSIANKYGMLGDAENALKWLERASIDHGIDPEFSFNIHFKNLHDHPRYIVMLEQLGLARP